MEPASPVTPFGRHPGLTLDGSIRAHRSQAKPAEPDARPTLALFAPADPARTRVGSSPSLSTMGPRGSSGTRGSVGHWAWDLSETKRLEGDSEFVFVSFWRHVHVVDHRHACVEEDRREAGRENDARFHVLEKGENERGLHGRRAVRGASGAAEQGQERCKG